MLYLRECECMKSLTDDIVVTCQDTTETPKSTRINHSDGINYCLIVLLSIACLLFLVTIAVKYYMKYRSAVPCLLS